MTSSSLWRNLVNIVAAPAEAFRSLREKPISWFPLVLLILAWIVFWNWYYRVVDYTWLIDHMIAVETMKAPPEQQAAIHDGIAKLKPGALIIISSLVVTVVLVLITVLTSAYLVIASAILNDDLRFKHWFSLCLWASIPSLFGLIAMTLNFFMAPGGRIGPENLNPINFYNLLSLPAGSRYASLLGSLDLTTLWTWALMAIGYRQWTQRSWLQSVTVVLIPVIGIYGIWAFLAWR